MVDFASDAPRWFDRILYCDGTLYRNADPPMGGPNSFADPLQHMSPPSHE